MPRPGHTPVVPRRPDSYVHGHHEAVLRSHTSRTVSNSAAHLVPHLHPGQRVLDVGCGPGTITADLADIVAPGWVVGVDAAADIVRHARDHTDQRRVMVQVGNVYGLAFADATFDVVHAHQVLQHLTEPVPALVEMKRVTKPGGLVAVRDADYGGMIWSPTTPLLERWSELYHQITDANGVHADAGRLLPAWARDAGLHDVTVSSSTWTYASFEERRWWGGLWADRVTASAYADQAISHGFADRGELEAIAGAWRQWAESDGALFVVPHVEVVARIRG